MTYHIELTEQISTIAPRQWNALCPTPCPFTRHEFLAALEQSNSVCAATGWQPVHLQIKQAGQLQALLPLYLKNHSYGEYVFDWAWADAYQRHGLNYYPKLVSTVPFSPISSPRLLTQADPAPLWRLLANQLPEICQQLKAHSWHLLFPQAEEAAALKEQLFIRQGCQYQWFNRNYEDFAEFLARMTSRKRKNLRKERQKPIAEGIRHQCFEGREITPAHLAAFYNFYCMTYFKRGRKPYLTYAFFEQLQATMPENLLLIMALKEDKPVAAALSLKDAHTLYGRYWGCIDEYDSLHFETCYYQGIEYCIEHQISRFDSGAQGEHKIQRGFEPVTTWSAHWLEEKGFNQAIAHFIDEENQAVERQMPLLASYLPFK